MVPKNPGLKQTKCNTLHQAEQDIKLGENCNI